ncbi:MAG TPA: hydroxymethylbilane synthase [Rhodobacteraceae bacterium]|jgi:hydroxymethylbilane synthase|nr:hydroxymethylbilane synthase [Paracoccaceae bacterium]HBV54573.1 hydroxymethylbilane synthase [Paracoccaceae bacterium]
MTQNMPTPAHPFRIGTRGSPLALAQAHETRARLMTAHSLPEAAIEIVVIKTTGDDRTLIAADRPLKEIGNKGLFTKEIEEALIDHRIDIAVHSMKDVPTARAQGLALIAYLPREDVRDAFVSLSSKSLADLPKGARVGTSSLRRRAQLLHRFSHLEVVEFRGNVQTRLKKLEDGVADATFLAMAGLNRLGLSHLAAGAIAPDEMLPAVAQGAIGIEARANDATARTLTAPLNCAPTTTRLSAERALLARLDGSCQTPIAALATLTGDTLSLTAQILSPDGTAAFTDHATGPLASAEAIGTALAETLLATAGEGFLQR